MGGEQGAGAPPQYSPDGKWWWDGSRWAPVKGAVAPTASATPRMPHQRPSFWIVLGVIALLVTGVCGAAVANNASTQARVSTASVASTRRPAAGPSEPAGPSTPTPIASPAARATAAPMATPTPPPAPTVAPPLAAAPPTAAPATPAGCYPLSNSGTCYEPGEFCRASDHGRTGRAGDGEAIICEYNNGWRWEPA